MVITKQVIEALYRKMFLIRQCEDLAIKAYQDKKWFGILHSSMGQEAAPAAAAVATRPTDYFVSNHRGHGHLLAKGVDPRQFMAELMCKQGGLADGRGGSMHMMDPDHLVYANGLVGSGAYIAAGIGLSIKYRGTDDVVVAFAGDGASSAGGFHEGVNFAAAMKLPVVFITENNGIAISTSRETTVPVANIAQRAAGYNMPGVTVFGADSTNVYREIKKAVDHARSGKGPAMVEVMCFRWQGHSVWDAAKYRTSLRRNEWKYNDPIPQLRQLAIGEGFFTEEELESIEKEVFDVTKDALEYGLAAPSPIATREEALKNVFVEKG